MDTNKPPAEVIDAAGLTNIERDFAFRIAAETGETTFDFAKNLPPEVRPFALAIGVMQAANSLLHHSPAFMPAGKDAPASKGLDYFEYVCSMPLSTPEKLHAADVAVKILDVAQALKELSPAGVRPFAVMVGLAEALRLLETSGKWSEREDPA